MTIFTKLINFLKSFFSGSHAKTHKDEFKPDDNQTVGTPFGQPDSEEIETEEYIEVLESVRKGIPVVFVTGCAGTGKTTLINFLRRKLKKKLAVLAPTGVAALNIAGVTIHSFFQFPLGPVYPDVVNIPNDFKRRSLYEHLEILIIDEISMVRADLMDGIDYFLRMVRGNGQPFGGVQLVLVGDLFQLPPVVSGQEMKKWIRDNFETRYFFSAKVFVDKAFYAVFLDKDFRHKNDNAFVDILKKIRLNRNLESTLTELNGICFEQAENRHCLINLTCTRADAEKINKGHLNKINNTEISFSGAATGQFGNFDEEDLPSPAQLKLKVGAQVMFTKNDHEKRWSNGSLGKIISFSENSIRVEILDRQNSGIYDVQKVTWQRVRYHYNEYDNSIDTEVIGTYTQYPLMLAWAITIHKSQGKTLESAEINLGDGAFEFGQTYVALSRCRSLKDIKLSRPVTEADVKCDKVIQDFYNKLQPDIGTEPISPDPDEDHIWLLDKVIELLDRHRQRATYGAVAGVVDINPRNLMSGRPRCYADSWIVSGKNGNPTGYLPEDIDPEFPGDQDVISDSARLKAWLNEKIKKQGIDKN